MWSVYCVANIKAESPLIEEALQAPTVNWRFIDMCKQLSGWFPPSASVKLLHTTGVGGSAPLRHLSRASSPIYWATLVSNMFLFQPKVYTKFNLGKLYSQQASGRRKQVSNCKEVRGKFQVTSKIYNSISWPFICKAAVQAKEFSKKHSPLPKPGGYRE